MNISQQVIILSAERKGYTIEQNKVRSEILQGCLSDCNLAYSVAQGVWQGGSEESLVVIVNNSDDIENVKSFAFNNFEQDAVLYCDANQEAYIIDKNGASEQIGRLLQVTKEVAFKNGNYTILNGEYYTTIKR